LGDFAYFLNKNKCLWTNYVCRLGEDPSGYFLDHRLQQREGDGERQLRLRGEFPPRRSMENQATPAGGQERIDERNEVATRHRSASPLRHTSDHFEATMKTMSVVAGLLCWSLTPAWALDFAELQHWAAQRAKAPYQPQDKTIPEALAKWDYNQYTAVSYRQDRGVWRTGDSKFYLQGFLRAYLYPERMRIHLLEGETSREYRFAADHFAVNTQAQPGLTLPALPEDFGYSGLRVRYPVNHPDQFDEVAVFQGASYFRMLGRGQAYGLSARGLAVDTATPGRREEFPAFTEVWVKQPAPDEERLRLYALLDGPTLAGAYEFTVAPGEETVADVRAALFFRTKPGRLGLAPLTSMFWYGENNYRKFVEFRPEVHDSDGLLIWHRDGSRTWRPLQTVTQSVVDAYPADRPRWVLACCSGIARLPVTRIWRRGIRPVPHCGWSPRGTGERGRWCCGRCRPLTNTRIMWWCTGRRPCRRRRGKSVS
jgi:glucan biosynthesis protein